MNKVLILGAGRGQVPIIKLCQKYGWYVVVVTIAGNWPGISIADKAYIVDITDKTGVLEVAKKEKISAILTDQLDEGVYTAAFVAEKLGIKGITEKTALKFTNKYEMRRAASEAGIAVPKYISATSLRQAEEILENLRDMEFPMIMKPADSSSSHGVYKVYSIRDIKEKFESSRSFSRSGQVIIEKFIAGKEYVTDAFTRNYQTNNLIVGHRDYFDIPDAFIPCATVFTDAVSADSCIEKRILAANKKLVEYFGLPFGITHGEYIYSPADDTVYLVEIAARGGGVFISSDLIPAASGVDANDLLVKEALNIGDSEPINIRRGAAAYFCYLTPQGRVTKLNNIENASNLPGVIKAFFDNIEIGMATGPIRDKASRKGPILVRGRTKQDCYDAIDRVRRQISIRVMTQNGEKEAIWR